MLTSDDLKEIRAKARPFIQRQMEDAKVIAGFRDMVSKEGGDWGALKAIIKAEIQDEIDENGNAKKVGKVVGKAEWTRIYADMLGLSSNLNEFNSFADGADDDLAGLAELDPKLLHLLIEGSKYEAGLAIIRAALAAVQENNEPAPPAEPEVAAAADPAPVGEAEEAPEASSATQSTAAEIDPLGTEGKDGVSPSPDRTLVGSEVAPLAGDQAEPGAGARGLPVDTNSELPKAAGETSPSNQPGARPEGLPEIGGNPEATQSPATVEGSSSTGGTDVGGDGEAHSMPDKSGEGDAPSPAPAPDSEPGNGHVGETPASAGAPAAGEAVHTRTSPAVQQQREAAQ